jgi:acid phosphatase type 7
VPPASPTAAGATAPTPALITTQAAPPPPITIVPPPPPPPPTPTAPPPPTTTVPVPPPPPSATGDPVIAAAGDIACDPANGGFNGGAGQGTGCQELATSDLLFGIGNLAAVLTLGDTQYETGAYPAFLASFDPSWGRLKPLIHPVVGNHEYLTAHAAGYYRYFGAAAGDPTQGYYSFDVGAWHLIALNSQCSEVGGCNRGSPQETWLRADLAAHPNQCTLAYWHIPLYSSGGRAQVDYTDFWSDLVAAGADLVLNGHDHIYERFAPQNASGAADPQGVREFVVGTGGNNHTPLARIFPNSEVRNSDTFGVLELTLHPHGYDWQFLPQPGASFSDAGSGACHH